MFGSRKAKPARRNMPRLAAARPIRSSLLLALEPRFVFDGAEASAIDPPAFDPGAPAAGESETAPGANGSLLDAGNAAAAVATPSLFAANAAPDSGDKELGLYSADAPRGANIVVIDSAVGDFEGLRDAMLRAGAEVHVLSPDRDGLGQIAEFLRGRADVQALHIVSHGGGAMLALGNSHIEFDRLTTQQALTLQRIGASLSDWRIFWFTVVHSARATRGKPPSSGSRR